MAELEDVTLDGKPLHSLRVADLKAALEQRGLAKSGQKNALIKRLKGALMLENLQRTSTPHTGRQPNSQIGEEMSQNSFIKQYLAKQQELLLQRLEREAREASEADERRSPTGKVEDDHTSAKDGTSFMAEKHHIIHPHMSQAECGGPDRGGGLPQDPGLIGSHRLDTGHVPVSQESPDTKAGRIWHPSFLPSHEEVATPSPPRAVASLSVRVVGQPERQGLPLIMPRSQETEGTAPVEAGPAHSVLQLSRSARAAPHVQVDSDDDEDEEDSGEDDDWGPSSHGKKNVRSPALHPPPAAPQRSRRKLQLPQHIPPQPLPVQQPPLQIRQPTPPPSPPPELSFPLPDTPKQSPHDQDEPVNLGEGAARPEDTSPQPLKRQTSSSSSRSSSPEPLIARRPGPLSLLARKMESEGVFHGANKAGMERETKMELEEPEVGEEGQSVQNVAHTLFGSSVPTRSISQPTPQGSRARKERLAESSDEQKKGADTSSSTLSSSLGFSLKRPQIFPHAKSPSKPEQLSVLTSGLKSSQDDAMEKRSTTISESKCDDKQIKFLEKPSLQSPEVAESDKTLKPLPTASEDKKIAQQQPTESSWSSSSDSDSESSSSYQSSSGSSQEKSRRKKGEKESGRPDAEEKRDKLSREVKQEALSEPAGQVAMELEGHSNVESVVQQSDQKGADLSDACTEENSSAKSIAARKISLSTGKAEISLPESESVGGGSRKRRWGSSTAVTAKKPSISITTDSLKTLIPEIKSLQDAVVELHPDEAPLSSDDSVGLQTREEPEDDQGLKIRRTVTQVVQSEGHENGKKETEEEENESEESKCVEEEEDKHKITESISPDALMETEESVAKKVTPSDSLVRRSISQQKSGVSITIDDPIRTGRQPSPPRGKASNIIHVCNLVRPFTLGQLKELLSRTGTLVEEGFWIDKIKSHCYVTYSSVEEAQATREALHGIKWPSSNPKLLRVDFCEQDELDFHKGLVTGERPAETRDPQTPVAVTPAAPPPLLPPHREKERERDGATAVRDQWAERERAMERRERTRAEREWDRDKVKDFGREDRDRTRRSRSRDRRRRERGRSKENKVEKKEKPEEPPAKLLDDLFNKTKAAPCIYWLPLTEEQAAQRVLERAERIKEREKRRKELQEEEEKKREELREKAKIRDRESGISGGNAARRSPEGERGRERERERAREGERRREQRPSDSKPAGGARSSRSRSNAERRH